MEESFSGLLRRAREGDASAVAEIYARYERRVRGVVRRRLGPALRRRCDSVDLVQSVFEDVVRELPRFEDRGEDAFRSWLFLKAENKVRDAWRRRLRPDGGLREVALAPGDEGRAVDAPGPATQAGLADDRVRLDAALSALPPAQREILVLRETQGLGFAEIAVRLALAGPDAARMRHVRALVALRSQWNRA